MPPVRIRPYDAARRRPTSMSRSPNALILVKGCFVLAVFLIGVSCYLYSLARAVNSLSNAYACVRKVEQQCELYPCEERNGVMEEITPPSRYFGYAGNFVRRQGNITKPHELFCKYFASAPLYFAWLPFLVSLTASESTQHWATLVGHPVVF